MLKEIGGYFQLELQQKKQSFYDSLLHLNSGRSALMYILKARKYSKIYIPYFTCDAVLKPIVNLKISYEFYDVNNDLEPIFDFDIVKDNEAVILTNYFGIKSKYISRSYNKTKNIIVDNAQALFSKPINEIDTFYSPRKFMGIPDGGLLSSTIKYDEILEQGISYDKMIHLLKRIDLGAQAAYLDFQKVESMLEREEIMKMSHLTKSLLSSIDFEFVKEKRIENYTFLHNQLKQFNDLNLELSTECVPLVYPFKTQRTNEIRNLLLNENIFCAKYWPNVLDWCNENENSYKLTQEIIAIPIDQRYEQSQMDQIIKLIKTVL